MKEAQMHDLHSKWYPIQLKPNSHNIALKNLEKQGFEVFMPLVEYTARRLGKFVNESRLLFPSYLFIHVKTSNPAWSKINNTRGVSRAVSFNGEYLAIPDNIIKEIRTYCSKENIFRHQNCLTPGKLTEINKGPLSKLLAEIDRIESNQRIWVLIDFMGQKSKVKMSV